MADPVRVILELMRRAQSGDMLTPVEAGCLTAMGYLENGTLTEKAAAMLNDLEHRTVGIRAKADQLAACAREMPIDVRLSLWKKIGDAIEQDDEVDFSVFDRDEAVALLTLALTAIISFDPLLQPEGAQ